MFVFTLKPFLLLFHIFYDGSSLLHIKEVLGDHLVHPLPQGSINNT